MAERDTDRSLPALSTTELANQRTDLAVLRSRMAADRTLMAWIRTSLSLISFGFTIYKFLQDLGTFLQKNGGPEIPVRGPRNLGLSLIALGTVGLVLASIEHWRSLNELNREWPGKRVWSLPLSVASVITLIGLTAFLSVLFRMGPF
jgi:inner membrane protein YidH